MSRSTLITAAVLAVTVLVIMGALLMEAASGPSFRPEDYDSYEECVRNIPPEWRPGSLQRDGAQEACFFVHRR